MFKRWWRSAHRFLRSYSAAKMFCPVAAEEQVVPLWAMTIGVWVSEVHLHGEQMRMVWECPQCSRRNAVQSHSFFVTEVEALRLINLGIPFKSEQALEADVLAPQLINETEAALAYLWLG